MLRAFGCGLVLGLLAVPVFGDDRADDGVAILVRLLADVDDPQIHRDVLKGLLDALRGRRDVPSPAAWSNASKKLVKSPDVHVRRQTRELAVLFGDATAIAELTAILGDATKPPEERTDALATLLQRRPAGLPELLQKLLDDAALRGPAIRALAEFNLAEMPALLLKRYPQLSVVEKDDAINTLASRIAWSRELVRGVADGRIPRGDVSAFTARQIAAFGDAALTRDLTAAWGELRPPSQDKAEQLARYRRILAAELVAMADAENGRKIFSRTCAACHVLFGEGGRIGPELTGAQRTNVDYVLENLLDPSALVGRDYQVTIVATATGRTIHGMVRQETPTALVLQTPNDLVTVPKDEIDDRKSSGVSLMPEGLLAKFTDAEVRDLVAYLASNAK